MSELLTAEERAQLEASFEQRSREYQEAVREELSAVRKILLSGSTASTSAGYGVMTVTRSDGKTS